MSFRVKLLLAIITVNVAVIGALTLTVIFSYRRVEANQLEIIQGYTSEIFRVKVREKAENFTKIFQRPNVPLGDILADEFWDEFVLDGIIINNVIANNQNSPLVLNIKGAKAREKRPETELAVRRITEAYVDGDVKRFDDLESRDSWMAVPFLKSDALVEAFAWYALTEDPARDQVRLELGYERLSAAETRAREVVEEVFQGIREVEVHLSQLRRSSIPEIDRFFDEAMRDLASRNFRKAVPMLQALDLHENSAAHSALMDLLDESEDLAKGERHRRAVDRLRPLAVAGMERAQQLMGQIHQKIPSTPQDLGGAYVLLRPPDNPAIERPTKPLLVIMIGGLLLLVLVSFGMFRRLFIHPLERMVEGAKRIGRGDYEHPLEPPRSQDEMATLVHAFNTMMERVGDYHRNLEERVAEATEKADAARRHLVIAQRLAATGTLASGIAHEINNPLGGLLNAARSLKRRHTGDEFSERYLELISDGLMRIGETVRKVLAFTPRNVEPAWTPVRSIIEKALALASHRLEKKSLVAEISGGDASILAVPGEMQQVFLNLIINAVDASDPGGRIEFAIEPADEGVEIRVRDAGMGMTEEEQENAFDLFFSTKEVGEGTGLGLSIVHHIVTNHGGTIEIESQKGEGTCFRIWFPRESVTPKD